ncbi:MAG: hypothetical protein GY847_24615 [Proteobacteria bacterium]|nr:hypothetical protein [Pseudomonadota bacterium]
MKRLPKKIQYRFKLPDGKEALFDLGLDVRTSRLIGKAPEYPPPWTALDFEQCPICPLTTDETPRCPAAIGLMQIADNFDTLVSFNEVDLRIEVDDKTITKKTTAQKGIKSLMGLILIASGCPETAFLRPMARFHRPLQTLEESFYRPISMYLLAQYFVLRHGGSPDFELENLKTHYENLHAVNASLARRLRQATHEDAAINAIILLDISADYIPEMIESSLAELEYLFDGYLNR